MGTRRRAPRWIHLSVQATSAIITLSVRGHNLALRCRRACETPCVTSHDPGCWGWRWCDLCRRVNACTCSQCRPFWGGHQRIGIHVRRCRGWWRATHTHFTHPRPRHTRSPVAVHGLPVIHSIAACGCGCGGAARAIIGGATTLRAGGLTTVTRRGLYGRVKAPGSDIITGTARSRRCNIMWRRRQPVLVRPHRRGHAHGVPCPRSTIVQGQREWRRVPQQIRCPASGAPWHTAILGELHLTRSLRPCTAAATRPWSRNVCCAAWLRDPRTRP